MAVIKFDPDKMNLCSDDNITRLYEDYVEYCKGVVEASSPYCSFEVWLTDGVDNEYTLAEARYIMYRRSQID